MFKEEEEEEVLPTTMNHKHTCTVPHIPAQTGCMLQRTWARCCSPVFPCESSRPLNRRASNDSTSILSTGPGAQVPGHEVPEGPRTGHRENVRLRWTTAPTDERARVLAAEEARRHAETRSWA
jgi:hypothetical protein